MQLRHHDYKVSRSGLLIVEAALAGHPPQLALVASISFAVVEVDKNNVTVQRFVMLVKIRFGRYEVKSMPLRLKSDQDTPSTLQNCFRNISLPACHCSGTDALNGSPFRKRSTASESANFDWMTSIQRVQCCCAKICGSFRRHPKYDIPPY